MLLEIKELTKEYGQDENKIFAVNNLNFSIEAGTFVAIMGKSGCGKTTLLNLLSGMDVPTSGSILLDSIDISSLSKKELSEIRKFKIGFVFQSFHLLEELTVLENILLPTTIAKKGYDTTYFNELIDVLGLSKQLNKYPDMLSGGQQQRVSIARSLINKPSILFADEPTGNLDTQTTSEVLSLLIHIRESFNQTIVMVTHDGDIAPFADRVITLSDGKILSDTLTYK